MRSLCFLVYLNKSHHGRQPVRWFFGQTTRSKMRSWMSWPVLLRHLKPIGGMEGQFELPQVFGPGWRLKFKVGFHKQSFFESTCKNWWNSRRRVVNRTRTWDNFQDTFDFFFDLTSFDKPFQSFASLGWTHQSPVLQPSILFAQQGLDVSCCRIAFPAFTWHCLERVTRPRLDVSSPPVFGKSGTGRMLIPPVNLSLLHFLRGDVFVCIDGTWQHKILNIELTSQEFIPWARELLSNEVISGRLLGETFSSGNSWLSLELWTCEAHQSLECLQYLGITPGFSPPNQLLEKLETPQRLRLLLDQPVNLVPQAGWQPPLTSGWWWESWGFGEKTRGAQVDNSGRSGLHVAWGIPDFAEMLKKHCCERWRV